MREALRRRLVCLEGRKQEEGEKAESKEEKKRNDERRKEEKTRKIKAWKEDRMKEKTKIEILSFTVL